MEELEELGEGGPVSSAYSATQSGTSSVKMSF